MARALTSSDQIAVLEQNPLRRPGRARRVHDAEQIIRGRPEPAQVLGRIRLAQGFQLFKRDCSSAPLRQDVRYGADNTLDVSPPQSELPADVPGLSDWSPHTPHI